MKEAPFIGYERLAFVSRFSNAVIKSELPENSIFRYEEYVSQMDYETLPYPARNFLGSWEDDQQYHPSFTKSNAVLSVTLN